MNNYEAINTFLKDLGYLNQYCEREYNYELRTVEYCQQFFCRNQLECFKQFVYYVDGSFREDEDKKDENKESKKKKNHYFDPDEILDEESSKNPLLSSSVLFDKCKQ